MVTHAKMCSGILEPSFQSRVDSLARSMYSRYRKLFMSSVLVS